MDRMTTQTGKLMVLFSPSPLSFYRLREYQDVEKAKEWCERFAAVPSQQNYVRLIVCDAINWQDFAPGTPFDSGHKRGISTWCSGNSWNLAITRCVSLSNSMMRFTMFGDKDSSAKNAGISADGLTRKRATLCLHPCGGVESSEQAR